MTKKCFKCGEVKPIEEYYKATGRGDGYRPSCKPCTYTPRVRILNPTRLCNVCKTRKPRGDFYSEKSSRCKVCDKARNKNLKRNCGPAANARKNNKRRNAGDCPKVVYDLVGFMYPACAKCGGSENLVIDHINPIALGGRNELTNFQRLCAPCNGRKGATYALYEQQGGRVIEHVYIQ